MSTLPRPSDTTVLRPFALRLLLLLIFSLAFMQPTIDVLGFKAVPTDFIYVALAAFWLIGVATGTFRLDWQVGWWLLLLYFAAMLVSALGAGMPPRSLSKLLTQAYLLSLPIVVCSLVRTEWDLRKALLAWLAGSGVVALVCLASLLAFWFDRASPILAYTRSDFGTLPPGDYPRLWLTFLNPNMLCNYLTVSVLILLAARNQQWIGRLPVLVLLAGIVLAALFTFSPGLGGFLLAVGLWLWVLLRHARPRMAALCLAGGIVAAMVFLFAAVVTPVITPDTPWLIEIPGIDRPFAPSVRLMAWRDALANFLAHPIFGTGIGSNAASIHYRLPSGLFPHFTDAHNMYLNISAQCGLLGLAALIAVIVHVWRGTKLFGSLSDGRSLVPLALGLAFLDAFAWQGLIGSYEDARHLWVLLGLFAASARLTASPTPAERMEQSTATAPS